MNEPVGMPPLEEPKKSNTGLIIGIVVGVIVVCFCCIVIAAGGYYVWNNF